MQCNTIITIPQVKYPPYIENFILSSIYIGFKTDLLYGFIYYGGLGVGLIT